MFTTDIYRLVEKIKRRFHTTDPYEIAEICGIEVISRKFDTMKGMYTVSEKNPYIFLNEELDEYMERVVMFHELGHHFMHRYSAVSTFKEHTLYDMSSKMEIEANTFTANFMISDEDIEQNSCYEYTSEQLARSLCIPHEILLIKLNDMNDRGHNFKLAYIPRADFLGR